MRTHLSCSYPQACPAVPSGFIADVCVEPSPLFFDPAIAEPVDLKTAAAPAPSPLDLAPARVLLAAESVPAVEIRERAQLAAAPSPHAGQLAREQPVAADAPILGPEPPVAVESSPPGAAVQPASEASLVRAASRPAPAARLPAAEHAVSALAAAAEQSRQVACAFVPSSAGASVAAEAALEAAGVQLFAAASFAVVDAVVEPGERRLAVQTAAVAARLFVAVSSGLAEPAV